MASSNKSRKEVPMKENGKPRSKARVLLSKENRGVMETGETSFRVYYGATGATVPFMWESQPGTPKHHLYNNSHDNILPPLTPPPSYTTSSSRTSSKKHKNSRILSAFFSSFTRKNFHLSSTSSLSPPSPNSGPLSWSTSSSSSSSPSSPCRVGRKHKSHKRSLSLCSSRARSPLFVDHEQNVESPSTSMCFGFKKQGCYLIQNVKSASFFY